MLKYPKLIIYGSFVAIKYDSPFTSILDRLLPSMYKYTSPFLSFSRLIEHILEFMKYPLFVISGTISLKFIFNLLNMLSKPVDSLIKLSCTVNGLFEDVSQFLMLLFTLYAIDNGYLYSFIPSFLFSL